MNKKITDEVQQVQKLSLYQYMKANLKVENNEQLEKTAIIKKKCAAFKRKEHCNKKINFKF